MGRKDPTLNKKERERSCGRCLQQSTGSNPILSRLRSEVQKFGNVTVSESKYWLIFKADGRAFTAINPSTRKARVFISCDPSKLNDPRGLARPSRSSGGWGKKYPLAFTLSSEGDIEYAISLIKQAYEHVLSKGKAKPTETKMEEKAAEVKEEATHDKIVAMLREIGEVLGFIPKVEGTSPDGVYRYDVTWRDSEAHAPIKVFEVEISRRIDHALSSLAHAYDIWRPETLYLIVLDERDRSRAIKLVDPYVKGAFYRTSRRLRIHTYAEIISLHEDMVKHKDLLRDLSLR